MRLTNCPSCGAPAEVEWSTIIPTTDGPAEHVKVRCIHRHWHLVPATRLPQTVV